MSESSTLKEFLTVRREGARQVSRNLEYYNLDAIISVNTRASTRSGSLMKRNDPMISKRASRLCR